MITLHEILSLLQNKTGIKTLNTDNDYKKLALIIENETGITAPHINTYKRMFNHFHSTKEYHPGKRVMNMLAIYFGFDSWDDLIQNYEMIEDKYKGVRPGAGGFYNDRRMELVIERMTRGTILTISYGKNSMIEIECIGKYHFRVMNAKNSDLVRNDKFVATNFIKGDEFRIKQVIRGNQYLGNYKAGRFQTITNVSHPHKVNAYKLLNYKEVA